MAFPSARNGPDLRFGLIDGCLCRKICEHVVEKSLPAKHSWQPADTSGRVWRFGNFPQHSHHLADFTINDAQLEIFLFQRELPHTSLQIPELFDWRVYR